MQTKSELREFFSNKKLEIIEAELAQKKILASVESFVANCKHHIGIYFPIQQEVDIFSILIRLHGHKFALPKIIDDKISFVNYSLEGLLEDNSQYPIIKEPQSNHEVVPQIVLVPALAYDIQGYRLGRGKGHYDKYFADHGSTITKVGISFNSNIIESLPKESHDCRMDYLISEDVVIKLR